MTGDQLGHEKDRMRLSTWSTSVGNRCSMTSRKFCRMRAGGPIGDISFRNLSSRISRLRGGVGVDLGDDLNVVLVGAHRFHQDQIVPLGNQNAEVLEVR